jgi:polysaccharide export outer membrane protein
MYRLAFLLASALPLLGSETAPAPAREARLFARDQVRVTVQGEPDMTVERQIDPSGAINVPLLGAVKIAGLTIAGAQQAIAERYIHDEIFIRPEVVVIVTAFAPKEVTVLGQVGKQGKILFPADTTSLSVVEAIADAGGLSRIAKGDAVRVTRRDETGADQTFTINVDKMVEGRGAAGEVFFLQPGDIVFVPERVF